MNHPAGCISTKVLMVLVPLVFGACGLPGPDLTYLPSYQQGREFFDAGEYERALPCFESLIEYDPDISWPYLLRALTLNELGRYEEAARDATRYFEKKKKDYWGYVYQKWEPDFSNIYFAQGSKFLGLGQYDQAIANYSRALELQPLKIGAHFGRGVSEFHAAKYEAAIADFAAALNQGVPEPEAAIESLWFQGFSYLALKNPEPARKNVDQMLQIDQRLKAKYSGKDGILIYDGVTIEDKMRKLAEDARNLELGGEYQKAFRQWEEMRLWPPTFRIWPATRSLASESSQAMARLYTKIPFKPEVSEDVRRLAVQADLASSNRQYAESAALYTKALNLAPWWPLGNYNAALTEAQAGLYADAVIHMNAFLAASPDAPNARTARDKIYEWEALAKKSR